MPLREHFHAPLADRRSWDAVHGGWPMMIVTGLGPKLPQRYVADPRSTQPPVARPEKGIPGCWKAGRIP